MIVFNIRVVASVRVRYLVQDRDCIKHQVQGHVLNLGCNKLQVQGQVTILELRL